MVEGVDFYFNEDGLMVFTEAYHLKRGTCCKNKCKHWLWASEKRKEVRLSALLCKSRSGLR
jgi:hypothetical protein